MVNELNNTISEAIGKLEKTVAIIEYLKFSIQDGMVNISDEAQRKQVLAALDKFTDIQKTNFKYIQAIEMLGSDMKLNLNALYPILPADVLRTVLGEQNNYEDLPEDLVSEIMGDESNNLNNSPVDDSIQKDSDEKNENDLMSQIMELAPKTESEVVTPPAEATAEATSEVATPPAEATPETTSEVTTPLAEATPEVTSEAATPPTEATPEATSEVATPPAEATPEATSEVATPPAETTPEATSEVATPPAEATPEATSEVATPPAEATSEATSEVATPPVEATSEATSEVATPPAETTPEATSEVATPPAETTPEATSEVATPPAETTPEATSEVATPLAEATAEATSETPNELDSIVLPSLDEPPAENTTVESTSSPNTEDTVLLPLNDENNGTVAEASTENKSTESTPPAKPEDTVLLPLSDENDDTISAEKSTENTADSFELLPLEVENPVNDKAESVDSNVVMSLDSTNLTENKNDDSMVGENGLVLPVLQQSLDIAEKPKADIASLDTSPVHAPLTLIPRGDSKALAVTSKQSKKLKESLVGQRGNPEIARVLKFPSQDSHESSLGNMIQESEEATASLENETDLETMMQEMEKAYSEGRVDEAERLSEKISNINKAHQKTLTLSNAA